MARTGQKYGAQTLKKAVQRLLKPRLAAGFSMRLPGADAAFLFALRRNLIADLSETSEIRRRRLRISGGSENFRERRLRNFPTVSGDGTCLEVAADCFHHAELAKRFHFGLVTLRHPSLYRPTRMQAASTRSSPPKMAGASANSSGRFASSLYERLALSRDKHEVRRLAREGQVVEKASDLIKDPVVLEFLDLEENPAYSESDLETAIIDRLQQFLLELGKGFLFEARQKRFSFDDSHFFVDLVFYNRLLRCYVLIDLKAGKLTHQDLGQMQMYVNYFDRFVRIDDELPTIGILLCDAKNDAVVKLTLPEDANIYASKYQLYLPSREELADQVVRVRREIGGRG